MFNTKENKVLISKIQSVWSTKVMGWAEAGHKGQRTSGAILYNSSYPGQGWFFTKNRSAILHGALGLGIPNSFYFCTWQQFVGFYYGVLYSPFFSPLKEMWRAKGAKNSTSKDQLLLVYVGCHNIAIQQMPFGVLIRAYYISNLSTRY